MIINFSATFANPYEENLISKTEKYKKVEWCLLLVSLAEDAYPRPGHDIHKREKK